MAKPVAVIADKITHAIDILRELKDIREINGSKRRLIAKDGTIYIIITEREQLIAWEISDILCIPTAHRNPNFDAIYEFARTRVK